MAETVQPTWQNRLHPSPVTDFCVKYHNRLFSIPRERGASLILEVMLRIIMIAGTILVYPTIAVMAVWGCRSSRVIPQAANQTTAQTDRQQTTATPINKVDAAPPLARQDILAGINKDIDNWKKDAEQFLKEGPIAFRFAVKCGEECSQKENKGIIRNASDFCKALEDWQKDVEKMELFGDHWIIERLIIRAASKEQVQYEFIQSIGPNPETRGYSSKRSLPKSAQEVFTELQGFSKTGTMKRDTIETNWNQLLQFYFPPFPYSNSQPAQVSNPNQESPLKPRNLRDDFAKEADTQVSSASAQLATQTPVTTVTTVTVKPKVNEDPFKAKEYLRHLLQSLQNTHGSLPQQGILAVAVQLKCDDQQPQYLYVQNYKTDCLITYDKVQREFSELLLKLNPESVKNLTLKFAQLIVRPTDQAGALDFLHHFARPFYYSTTFEMDQSRDVTEAWVKGRLDDPFQTITQPSKQLYSVFSDEFQFKQHPERITEIQTKLGIKELIDDPNEPEVEDIDGEEF